ncbi:MAG: 2-octaprenylphenol hydroxylase [Halieaceae bacterium]|jgi:2-octaprenylphenol hydroxylase
MAEENARTADIIVIGGGIAGLATAMALSGQGLSIVVMEARELAAAPPHTGDRAEDYDSRVSALTPRSMAFLGDLGAWPLIAAQRHCPYHHMTVWDAEGTGRIEFDAAEAGAGQLGSIVENRLITAALAERVRTAPDVQLLTSVQPTAVDAGGDTIVITLADDERWSCELLVAADGALSRTRDMLGLRTREWDYGHRAIVTTARFERVHEHTAWQRFLPTGPLALLPLAGGEDRLCSIVWSIEEAQAEPLLALNSDDFASALTQASEHTLGRVSCCAERRAFPLRQRHAVDYVAPGVALVGDAAHTIHPLAGQGVNLGLADVQTLAAELSSARQRGLGPGRIEVLRRYQRQRKGENLAMMAAMDGFKRLFEQSSPPVRWLRNSGMRAVGSLPSLKRRIIREAMGVLP